MIKTVSRAPRITFVWTSRISGWFRVRAGPERCRPSPVLAALGRLPASLALRPWMAWQPRPPWMLCQPLRSRDWPRCGVPPELAAGRAADLPGHPELVGGARLRGGGEVVAVPLGGVRRRAGLDLHRRRQGPAPCPGSGEQAAERCARGPANRHADRAGPCERGPGVEEVGPGFGDCARGRQRVRPVVDLVHPPARSRGGVA